MIKSFRDLKVWEKGMHIVTETYSITSGNAFHQDFGLRDQMRRSAVSILQILLKDSSVKARRNSAGLSRSLWDRLLN